MIKGTVYAVAACLVWGLIFIIPSYLEGFDPLEIALGRHAIYGMVSCFLLLGTSRESLKHYSLDVWKKAILFSLVMNIIYYFCVVVGVQYASPSLTALVLGISPVVISFYGNWLEDECSFKSLIPPSLLILVGLALVNIPFFLEEELGFEKPLYLTGALASCGALLAWSWYVVANSRFLKSNPIVRSQDWSTLIGVCTFGWVIIVGTAYEGWQGSDHWQKFITPTSALGVFVSGCAVLGILCSWVGAYLWNNACALIPVSLAGQLTIFETIFALLYFYILEQQFPPLAEFAGIFLMLFAIAYEMNTFVPKQPHVA